MVQAAYGDCLLVEAGPAVGPHFLLVDGGPSEIYGAHLRPVLKALAAAGRSIDLAVLSHIDNDHVRGLLALFAEVAAAADDAADLPRIRRLWHNSFAQALGSVELTPLVREVVEEAGAAVTAMPSFGRVLRGFEEGDALRRAAEALRIPLNPGIPGGHVLADGARPWRLGPASVRVVGPSREVLERLRLEWLRWLARNRRRLQRGVVAALAADRSVPNLSSICLLVTAGRRSLLLTGDARGDQVLAGLAAAGELDAGGRRPVSVLKLPHHGSARNVDRTFLRAVPAHVYVISADGRYGNPDHEALRLVVETAAEEGRRVRLVATNRTASLDELVESHPPSLYGYGLRVLPPGRHAVALDVPTRALRRP